MSRKSLILTVCVLGGAGLAVSACGRMADLEAPPARQSERAQRGGEVAPLPDPATRNRSSNQIPIDGGPGNPYRGSGSPFQEKS